MKIPFSFGAIRIVCISDITLDSGDAHERITPWASSLKSHPVANPLSESLDRDRTLHP